MVNLGWSTNTDWTAAQSTTNIDINSGTFELADAIPDSALAQYDAQALSLTGGSLIDPWPDEINSNDLSAGSAPTYQTGEIGTHSAAVFSGDDILRSGAFLPNYTSSGFSLVSVIKTADTSSDMRYATAFSQGTTPYAALTVNSGTFEIDFRSSTGNFQNVSTGTSVADGTPRVAIGVFDLANQRIRGYVGQSEVINVSNAELSGDFLFADNSTIVSVGDSDAQGLAYTGSIGELLPIDEVFTQQEAVDEAARLQSKWGL